jgi:hypothetical protein
MATKNRIAYALPIIQIIQILSDKFHKQMCLRLIYRERVGIIPERPKSLENAGLLRYGIAP